MNCSFRCSSHCLSSEAAVCLCNASDSLRLLHLEVRSRKCRSDVQQASVQSEHRKASNSQPVLDPGRNHFFVLQFGKCFCFKMGWWSGDSNSKIVSNKFNCLCTLAPTQTDAYFRKVKKFCGSLIEIDLGLCMQHESELCIAQSCDDVLLIEKNYIEMVKECQPGEWY